MLCVLCRPLQREAINAALQGRDALCLMPTGEAPPDSFLHHWPSAIYLKISAAPISPCMRLGHLQACLPDLYAPSTISRLFCNHSIVQVRARASSISVQQYSGEASL